MASEAPDAATPDPSSRAAPACTPVARPPTIDVHLHFSTGSTSFGGSMPAIATLVAKVTAPSVKLSHEIWSSPAPTTCSARPEGDDMVIHCITDEGQLKGRVRIDQEELIVESVSGLPPLPAPVGAGAASAAGPAPKREASIKVPCGARLRAHSAHRDYL